MTQQSFEDSPFAEYTLDMFLKSAGNDHSEIAAFNKWRRHVISEGLYTFELTHLEAQKPLVAVENYAGKHTDLISFASYNYFGYSYHPDVIAAAKAALDTYGLGATGSPLLNGTFRIHHELEQGLVDFFDMPNKDVSLFSSGYGANVGVISAYVHKGDYVLMDRLSHASIVDGAILSQATIKFFKHNDAEHMGRILNRISIHNVRVLVCIEGIYSADGDSGNLAEIVKVAKEYGATVLVDEAHSILIAGDRGRGVIEDQGVMEDVDMIICTFSKSFGGVGGCLVADEELIFYINYYARARMFSCAIDPAVTGGIIKALELASGPDGDAKRLRIMKNAAYLRGKLQDHVDIGDSNSWIMPVIYGKERITIRLNAYLQESGLDTSLMQFPAVPKNQSRIRLFVTSEHTEEQMDRCVEVISDAAKKFGFHK